VRDPETGKTQQWALDLINDLNSYTELSPRGSGCHIWLRGKAPAGKDGIRTDDLELYFAKRSFTITAQHAEGTPTEMRKLDASEVARLVTRVEERRRDGKKRPCASTKTSTVSGREKYGYTVMVATSS